MNPNCIVSDQSKGGIFFSLKWRENVIVHVSFSTKVLICLLNPGFHRRIRIREYTHTQKGIFDSILDTSSPQPDDKQDGGQSVRNIAFDEFA